MIIAISSQNGGTRKTSTSISLAAGLARKGKRTLLVDVDSQANSSKVLLPDYLRIPKEQTIYATILERKPLPVHPTGVAQLSVVPSHILLSNTDVELTIAIDHREEQLKRQLTPLSTQYDYVIVDCPPALSWLTINAFTAADQVLVVVSPGYFELDSIVQISKTIQEVQDYFNPQLTLAGYLFTMSDATVNTRTSIQVLRQTYTDRVLQTIIPRNTDIRDAHFTLRTGQAFIRLPNDTVKRVQTPRLPVVSVPAEQLAEVQEYYLHRYFRPLLAPPPAGAAETTAGAGSSEHGAPLPISPRPATRRDRAVPATHRNGPPPGRKREQPTRPTGTVYTRSRRTRRGRTR